MKPRTYVETSIISYLTARPSRDLSIDPRAGGCFCERLGERGSAQRLSVVFVSPGETSSGLRPPDDPAALDGGIGSAVM